MNKHIVIGIIAVVILSGTAVLVTGNNNQKTDITSSVSEPTIAFAQTRAVVYKSPTCGCCEGHAEAMKEAGIDVEIIELQQTELSLFKEDKGVPGDMQSCHTTMLTHGDKEYVVEGHIPIEGLSKLVTEQPDIPGIVLPGMPMGTPGMPGPKTAPYNIMTLEETPQPYLSI